MGLGGITFGITFYTIFIAYQLSKYGDAVRQNPAKFLLSAINPIYLFTGPVPNKIIVQRSHNWGRTIKKRFKVINSDLLVGILFSTVLAPSLTPYFYLKDSTQIIDILLFGVVFELYVYFNFSGFSMISWSLMRLLGVKVNRNFRQPFGANSIVEYWQRWHISLSNILKELFFWKCRSLLGVYGAVFCVFLASALWHGVSTNFVVWGLFHSILWCLAHYFHKVGFRALNYILLFFGVVVGRVIFSELNWSLLATKLMVIFDVNNWKLESDFVITTHGYLEALNLMVALLVIALEILMPRLGFSGKNYEHLRSPTASMLVAVYICCAFSGIGDAPLYGNR